MQPHWDGEDLKGSEPLSKNLLPIKAMKYCKIPVLSGLFLPTEMNKVTFEASIQFLNDLKIFRKNGK